MLTDIFAERYAGVPIWAVFGEAERRLLVQAFRVVAEQLFPYWDAEGKERKDAKEKWGSMHSRLSMELGLQQLAPLYYEQEFQAFGGGHKQWVKTAMVLVCQSFVLAPFDARIPADRFIKDRLSFIELAFRDREAEIAARNAELPKLIAKAQIEALSPVRGIRVPGEPGGGVRAFNKHLNDSFRAAVDELNERLRRADTRLHYHNGFLQLSDDALITEQVEAPFWDLVGEPKWMNVDTDMKEAIDRRDSGVRDAAFYATRALESTIKIISADKGLTRGSERGAAGYIDNLVSKANGRFIEPWEGDFLKEIFSHVRNELGHGPGGEPMPELSPAQTNWAIEACMSWIKSLVRRS